MPSDLLGHGAEGSVLREEEGLAGGPRGPEEGFPTLIEEVSACEIHLLL